MHGTPFQVLLFVTRLRARIHADIDGTRRALVLSSMGIFWDLTWMCKILCMSKLHACVRGPHRSSHGIMHVAEEQACIYNPSEAVQPKLCIALLAD